MRFRLGVPASVLGALVMIALTPACPEEQEPAPPATDGPRGSAGRDWQDRTRGADGGAGARDGGADAGAASEDVPGGKHCAAVAQWEETTRELEMEVFRLVNEARAKPQDCGVYGVFAATTPLVMEPRLRCAARLHSVYMARAMDDFEHDTRDGTTPASRVVQSGYEYQAVGENLGVGERDPTKIVEYWLASDGHCSVLMHPAFTDVGVGLAEGRWDTKRELGVIDAPYWTLDFAAPLSRDE